LYYERAGTGVDVPFRLTDFKSLTETWVPLAFNIEWRRYRQNNNHLLIPQNEFGLSSLNTLDEFDGGEIFKKLKDEVQSLFSVTPKYNDDKILEGQE